MPISVRPQIQVSRRRQLTAFTGHRHRQVSGRSLKPRTRPRHRCLYRCQCKIGHQSRRQQQPRKITMADRDCSPKRLDSARRARQSRGNNPRLRQNPVKGRQTIKGRRTIKKCRKREFRWMNSPPMSEPRWSASPCRPLNPPMRKKLRRSLAKKPAHRSGP